MSTEQNTKDKGMFARELELGGFWKRSTKNGATFLSGKITVDGEQIEVTVWKNTFKDASNPDDRSPDWRMYKSLPREEQETTAKKVEKAVKTAKGAAKKKAEVEEVEEVDGESTPF